ncbi:MAG: histidine kinase [Sphingomonadales bacterium]|nr:histidine kinase [Sphingomonadales bacterium]
MKLLRDLLQSRLLHQAVPVAIAMLVAALSDHIASGDPGWSGLIGKAGHVAILLVPALGAHLLACRWPPLPAAFAWLGGFAAYPVLVSRLYPAESLPTWQWVMAAVCSLIFVLLHPAARSRSGEPIASPPPIARLPITLDRTIAVLLGLWVLGVTMLFASTPDAVRNQPLQVWVNWRRMAAEPGETVWYLAQFSILAGVVYVWYKICRYVLVRGVLRRHGLVPFGFAVAAFVALATPVAASIGLLMPLNIAEWTIIPSENHNPFDWTNYRFTIWLTAIFLPLVLTVERLLAEHAEASNRHERVRAELHMLQQQINPHFLFNTLNTLYALCLKDRMESAAAVIKLSDLLRYAVYHGSSERSRLDDEVAYLKNYLDLQMLRFGHRCSLETTWPDSNSDLALPPLLLIMLVENAFKHGVEPVEGDCNLRIALSVEGRRMRFECTNSLPKGVMPHQPGIGLTNLRRRLELLFGNDFSLLAGPSDGAWRSSLELDLVPC